MSASSIIPTLDEYILSEQKFLNILNSPEIWRKIPILNYIPPHELKEHALVRFRGMIQDMLDPEIYLEKYEVINSTNEDSTRLQNGKYKDYLQTQPNEKINFESEKNVHGERRTFFLVSLPGINSWASEVEQNSCKKESDKLHEEGSSKITNHAEVDQDVNMESETDGLTQRQCTSKNVETLVLSTLSAQYLLNSPIPNRPSKACMVKIYTDFDSYALNTLVDVVGFLSVDATSDCALSYCDDFESNIEMQAQNPPSSLIPRLHVIAIKKLNHNNPLLDIYISEQAMGNFNFAVICKELKIILTQCLFGDNLSAEYLLLHLLSTVYVRSEINSIGKFTLNICNLHQPVLRNYMEEFYKILELLLPASHFLPMTLETMNTLQFFPKKDYETNKLVSGILQLAPMTHFVLDETQMASGILDASGIKAMQNLSYLIKTQQIKCDFSYYDIDYNVDIPVLILSEGKSILPNDFLVPLNPEINCGEVIEETLKAVKYYAQPKLDIIRRYITAGKMSNFSIHRNDRDNIEVDFVEMRKHNKSMGADELHNLLLLSRLLAISNGKTEFNKMFWEQAKQMEKLRTTRINHMPKPSRHL